MSLSTLKNQIPLAQRESINWAMLLNPTVPLAAYFCISTMLPLLAELLELQHPAYWMFGWLAICLIHVSLCDGRLIMRLRPVDFAFAAFVLIVLFSWAATGRTGGSRVLVYVLTSMAIPWLAARLLTASQIGDLVAMVAIIGTVMALGYWIAIPFMQDFAVNYERVLFFGENTVYGVFGPTVGLFAVMGAVYLILPHAAQSKRLNGAVWVMLPISYVAIVHMGGRGMFVSALLALLASCAFVRQSAWKRKIAVISVVLASSIVGLALVSQTRLDHYSRLIGFVHDYPDRAVNNTVEMRWECYREAVEIFLSKPVTGTGTGTYGLKSHCLGKSSALTTPHSTVFHVLAELGVSGAVPFFVLNLMLMGIAWRVVRVQSGDPISGLACVVAAVWFYILIYDQISANYLTSFRYYLFSGLLISLYPALRNIKKGNNSHPNFCAFP